MLLTDPYVFVALKGKLTRSLIAVLFFFLPYKHTAGNSSCIASSSSFSEPPVPSPTTQAPKRSIMHKGSKLVGIKMSSQPHDADISEDFSMADDSTDEPSIIAVPLSPQVCHWEDGHCNRRVCRSGVSTGTVGNIDVVDTEILALNMVL